MALTLAGGFGAVVTLRAALDCDMSSAVGHAADPASEQTAFGAFLNGCMDDSEFPLPQVASPKPVGAYRRAAPEEKRPAGDMAAPVAVPADAPDAWFDALGPAAPAAPAEGKPDAVPQLPVIARAPSAPEDFDGHSQAPAAPELAFRLRLIPEEQAAGSGSSNTPPANSVAVASPDASSLAGHRIPDAAAVAPEQSAAPISPASPGEAQSIAATAMPPGGISGSVSAATPAMPAAMASKLSPPPRNPQPAPRGVALSGSPKGSAHTSTEEDPAGRTPDAVAPLAAVRNAGFPEGHADTSEGQAPPAAADLNTNAVPPPPVPDREPLAPNNPCESGNSLAPPVAAPSQAASQPVSHDVALRLDDGQNNVDIRLAERGGEIRVTVHTSDRDLAGTLRADLPDLVGKLRQSGFQAEAWRPVLASQPDSSRRGGSDDRGDPQDSPGARRDGRQPPNQQQHKNPSRWAGEWQSRLDPAQEQEL
jgi:hypothetical protein